MSKRKKSFFNRKIKLSYSIIITVLLMLTAAVATYFLAGGRVNIAAYQDDAKKYVEIEQIINDNYIGDFTPDELQDAAAAALVRGLGDKWSYYMTADEYEAYKLSAANEYAGIGVSVKPDEDGNFVIMSVAESTPAATAGLAAGQIIVSIDGEEVAGMTLTEVKTLMRSKLNKDFPMVIEDDEGNQSEVTVSCTTIYSSPVSNKMLSGNIGYVKISNFEAGCSEDFISAVEHLMADGAESFIFDVRDNPGGLLAELVAVLDYLLPEGDLFVSVDKAGNETVTSSDKVCLKCDMAVLVNGNSYSAAEFFAAALQEYDWATIVGEHTTGKSRSQITIELSDGSAVHLSTCKYLTPKGVDLAEEGGVAPDLEVANEKEGKDSQLVQAQKLFS